jgi:predicted DCC family thiol-disulfide oxidoreductase YuxK
LYDADCAFCSAQMRRLKRLDWRRRLELVPMAEAGTLCDRAGIERVALAGAIHGVGENGRVTRAARCLREMALRIPLLVPVGLVLFLPGALRLAEWLYRRVAARRHELSGWACAGGACRGSRPAGG